MYLFVQRIWIQKPSSKGLFFPCQLKILTVGQSVYREYLIRFYQVRQVVYTPQMPTMSTEMNGQKNVMHCFSVQFQQKKRKKKKKLKWNIDRPSSRQGDQKTAECWLHDSKAQFLFYSRFISFLVNITGKSLEHLTVFLMSSCSSVGWVCQ